MRAFISICAWRDVDVQTAYSVMQTLLHSKKHQFGWAAHTEDALIDRARSVAATAFLDDPERGEVLVFVDSDISFHPDDIEKLVDHIAEGKDIVGGVYVTRSQRLPKPAVRLLPGQTLRVGSDEPTVEIQYVSTGFVAISRNCLEQLANNMARVRSGLDLIYPFFMPFVYRNEYLSEDWAMNQRARDLGMKVWADPSIHLSHWGRRAYVLDDITRTALDNITNYTIIDGQSDITDIIGDMASYSGLSRIEMAERIKQLPQATTIQLLANEWHTRTSSILDYYKDSRAYLPELINYNLNPKYWDRVYKALSAHGRVADFGGGIGTVSIMLAPRCSEVFYVDLPSQHKRFAEYRFQKHNLTDVIKSRDTLEGLSNLDYIVAVDVMEHIEPSMMASTVKLIASSLKSGGTAITMNEFGVNDTVPQHYDTEELFTKEMLAAGFTGGPERWVKR